MEAESESESRSLRLYSPWNSPGQNTGVGSFPFTRGSSQSRDQSQVSHNAGGPPGKSYVREVFITVWASTEHRGHLVLMTIKLSINYKALDDGNKSLHSTVPGQDKERTGVTVGA